MLLLTVILNENRNAFNTSTGIAESIYQILVASLRTALIKETEDVYSKGRSAFWRQIRMATKDMNR